MIEIELPMSIILPRKTKKDREVKLNLNVYRNLHYHINNSIKKKFKEKILYKLESQLNSPIYLIYVVRVKRMKDLRNITTVIDKFFCDALVEAGCIDNDKACDIPVVTDVYDDSIKEDKCFVYIFENKNSYLEVLKSFIS